jgi:hypothetical protein
MHAFSVDRIWQMVRERLLFGWARAGAQRARSKMLVLRLRVSVPFAAPQLIQVGIGILYQFFPCLLKLRSLCSCARPMDQLLDGGSELGPEEFFCAHRDYGAQPAPPEPGRGED